MILNPATETTVVGTIVDPETDPKEAIQTTTSRVSRTAYSTAGIPSSS